jgi:ABC-type maltose transport system permease subunit
MIFVKMEAMLDGGGGVNAFKTILCVLRVSVVNQGCLLTFVGQHTIPA